MKFNYHHIDLPVTEIVPDLIEKLKTQTTLVLNAPPGAGKSTLLPLVLLGENWLEGKKIIMLEPRRLAARSIAIRMAELLGERVGKTVGYRVRFDNKVSVETKLEVVTEGILTRMLQSDNSLSDVGLVIFDEFHERSIHADVALAFTRESQQVLRPDLRILIMSATLNTDQMARKLKAETLISKGKQYPVEVINKLDYDYSVLPEMVSNTVIEAVKAHSGDVLVFLPGQGEILRTEEQLRRRLKGINIHPLYGQLPQAKQLAAILPNKEGKRKVVLATSIAETSLTIEGITVVVDCGYSRVSKFDPRSGLSRLETIQVSRDSADQRAGRAGRLSPGTCYRLWSKATDLRLNEHRTPEIMEVDLTSLVLELAQWGITDPDQLLWITNPPKGAIASAGHVLHQLEALNRGKITEHGKRISALPCHPRIAHMLLESQKLEQIGLAADIAALMEERDPLGKEAGIDINTRIDALRRHRSEGRKGRKFDRIEKVSASYRQLFDQEAENSATDPYETGLLMAYAFPERIASARPGNNAQFQLANGKYAMVGHRDDLAHEAWLAVGQLDAREGTGKVFLAAPLNPQDLAPMVKEKEVIKWDTDDGGLVATKDLRIGSIVLRSTPLPDPDPQHLVRAISDAISEEGSHLLDWNEEVQNWQNRVLSLRKWNPQDDWPDVSQSTLLLTNDSWLSPYLNGIKRPQDLKKLNLREILTYTLDHEKQLEMDKLAPERLKVPSGSSIKINYRSNGESPVLAVRIQEIFGMAQTPTLNKGKVPMLVHLLSPGFKPVQVTSDLANFWEITYFEVRKELKGRYPKHSWPDDPITAEPLRGAKPRNIDQ